MNNKKWICYEHLWLCTQLISTLVNLFNYKNFTACLLGVSAKNFRWSFDAVKYQRCPVLEGVQWKNWSPKNEARSLNRRHLLLNPSYKFEPATFCLTLMKPLFECVKQAERKRHDVKCKRCGWMALCLKWKMGRES